MGKSQNTDPQCIESSKPKTENESGLNNRSVYWVFASAAIITFTSFFGLIAEWETTPTGLWGFLIFVAVLLIGAAVVTYYQIKNRAYTLTPLNQEMIWRILCEEGFEPQSNNDHIDISIALEVGQYNISIGYHYPRLNMWYGFTHRDMDLSAAQMIADKITNELIMIQADVKPSNDNQDVNVCFYIAALCHYEAEFRDALRDYIHLLAIAIIMYADEVSPMGESDAKIKRQHIYYSIYRLLPNLFSCVSKGKIRIEALTDEAWIRLMINAKLKEIYIANQASDWDSFKINRVENFGGYKLIVYQFPDPKFVPEAKYGVVMLNTTTLTIDYYTMELSFDGQWAYCSCTTERHYNYGSFDSGELDDFLKWVLEDKEQLQCSTDWKTGEIKPAEPDSGKDKDAEPQAQPNYDIVADGEDVPAPKPRNELLEKIKEFGFAIRFIVVLAALVLIYFVLLGLTVYGNK
ncbi:MAG: hypothetical protein II315_02600 [Rikenellaceae bacterium]|nr:hypothetical protein [Rikenellaceae bacterium]MBQ5719589.1 hypothetical protein [Alistipes sp.]